MPLLSEKDQKFLREHLREALAKPVRLLFFTQSAACQFCKETEQVLREVAELSDKITLEVHDFVADKEIADRYGVDKIPATVVMSDVDYGIRFYGIPSGFEFTSLIEDIIDVSRGAATLSDETRKALEKLPGGIHLQVFVTPTCPYCPSAVRMAHSLAIASDKVRADMIESIEFPHLANKYSVYGVPRTVINETVHVEGPVVEELLVAHVMQAAGMLSEEEVQRLAEKLNAQAQAPHEHHEHQ